MCETQSSEDYRTKHAVGIFGIIDFAVRVRFHEFWYKPTGAAWLG